MAITQRRWDFVRGALVVAFVAGLLAVVGISPVAAATRHVTTCSGNAATAGSLPNVVAVAGSGDTIVFDLDCPPASPIILAASLTPTVNLTIDGTGRTVAIDGGCTIVSDVCNGGVTVVTVASGRTVNLTALTIQNGLGGIRDNGGTLTVTNGTVSGNATVQGGGIFASSGSTVTITGSTITGNTTTTGFGFGGGIRATATALTITGSAITGNRAGNGGGIYADGSGGTLTMTRSTVSGNTVGATGGGLFISSITASVAESTISGNTAMGGQAGGIRLFGGSTSGSLALRNSTVTGNTATGPTATNVLGGGLWATTGQTGALTISGSTISGNAVTGGGASIVGGGIRSDGGNSVLHNTVIAGNTSAGSDPDVNGGFNTSPGDGALGYNAIGIVGSATGLVDGVNQDRVGTAASPLDPQLGPLADNGGPTRTLRPLAGSLLLDRVPAGAGCNNQGLTTDQRGVPRPQGTLCDIGAVEVATAPFATLTALAANPPTAPAGVPVTLSATVTSSAPALLTGTVSFLDGTATLGSAPVNASGVATFQTTFTTAGNHSLTALYGGTSGGEFQFSPSQSATLNYAVTATLAAVSPASGGMAGGNTLTLTGTGFLAGATASVGGTPCPNVQVASNTTLTCTAPARATAGAVNVAVTTAGVTRTLTNAYTYGTVNPLPPPPPSGGTPGTPNVLPDARGTGGTPGNPNPLPPPR